jgi:hypothetical protein
MATATAFLTGRANPTIVDLRRDSCPSNLTKNLTESFGSKPLF